MDFQEIWRLAGNRLEFYPSLFQIPHGQIEGAYLKSGERGISTYAQGAIEVRGSGVIFAIVTQHAAQIEVRFEVIGIANQRTLKR